MQHYNINMIFFEDILGLNADQLSFYHMAARALLTFFFAILLLRISGLRTMGNHSAFDNLTVLIMGAIMGRGIVVADQPFFEAMGILTIIVILHRILAWGTVHSKVLGKMIKGKPILLMKDSVWQKDNMSHAAVSQADIEESLRQEMRCDSFSKIKDIYIERSGKISFVQKEDDRA